MLVFIDDSGDPGFKLDRGSDRFFVISLVIFDDHLEAEKTAVAIKELRRELGYPDGMEFKFNKSSTEVKKAFLKTVARFDFRVRSLIVNKKLIKSPELRTNRDSFYSYFIKMALQHSNGTIAHAKIKIDGSGDKIFKKSFLSYLRKQLSSEQRHIMRDCKLVDSKSNVLIQLADMVAGATRRYHDASKEMDRTYKRIIQHRINDEWTFR